MSEKLKNKSQFRQADALFQAGQYMQALLLLQRLEVQHPDDHHLVYPQALCLGKLGRYQEAIQICDRLITEFHYDKALEMKAKFEKRMQAASN